MTEIQSPWHPGEIQMQRTIGAEQEMDAIGRRVVRDHLIDQHRDFYPLLPFVLLGTVDPQGWPWATLRAGVPGFLAAPDRWHLDVMTPEDPEDPASAGLRPGGAVGLLGIQPETRRRNRLNGILTDVGAKGLRIGLTESFGNCPKYIQGRVAVFVRDPAVRPEAPPERISGLDAGARDLIRRADTFFVASHYDGPEGRRVDVSHRGGLPGFVRIDADGTLTIPDFAGNRFFSTLGNIVETGRAGLLFVDWTSGDTLQISGEASVLSAAPEGEDLAGAERYWQVRPRFVVRRRGAVPLRWQETEQARSPFLDGTGVWADRSRRSGWQSLRLQAVTDESAVVRSLHLVAPDGGVLPPARAGQHLPLRIVLPDGRILTRAYTLSRLSDGREYRISVKRDGVASTHLHSLMPGAMLEAGLPGGQFVLDPAEAGPVLLLAAGIGVTPIRAMLEAVVAAGGERPVWVFQVARTVQDRALTDELTALAAQARGRVRLIRLLSAPGDAVPGRDYDRAGRLNTEVLTAAGVPDLQTSGVVAYLCGPPSFMQGMYDLLRQGGLADRAIRAEGFGPAALRRDRMETAVPPPAGQAVSVRFSQSGVTADWTPGAETLLDVAERAGLSPAAGCRGGACGTCAAQILSGQVTPVRAVSAGTDPGWGLLCSVVPAQGTSRLEIAL